jgi:L,D-transpeptidase YcbB
MIGLGLDRLLAACALGLVLATPAVAGPEGGGAEGPASVETRAQIDRAAEAKPEARGDVARAVTADSSPQPASPGLPESTATPAERPDGAAFPGDHAAQGGGDALDGSPVPGPPAVKPMLAPAATDTAGSGAAPPAIPGAPVATAPEVSSGPQSAPAEGVANTPSQVAPTPAKINGGAVAPMGSNGTTERTPNNAGKTGGPAPNEGKDAAGASTSPAKDAASSKESLTDKGAPIAADLTGPDIAIAEKLREILGAGAERMFERKNERAGASAFYSGRGFAPLWIEAGVANERAKTAIARLKAADADGLDPADYPTPDFVAAAGQPDALAEAELRLTGAVLTYARHAQTGRVHFSRVSGDVYYNLAPPEPAEVLAHLAKFADVGDALGSYNPPQSGFEALRKKLAEIRDRNRGPGAVRIAAGPTIRPGMRDQRVPRLRDRLGIGGADDGSDTKYDQPLAEAVRKFQREHGLPPTGNFNSATLEALNGPRREHGTDIIIANMERWRWLPRDLGRSYVMVNIPDYTLKVVEDGATVWRTRIVAGKPSTPTPLLSEPMRYITINPTWNVPPSIVYNEYLPVLRQDPYALARIGLQVEYNPDGSIHIFQPPGAGNALGRIRFNFPNKFLVYQHDTPEKNLFARERRAFSHGCMRVQDPLKYAEILLSIGAPKEDYTAERLQRMFGGGERDINLSPTIPVHVTYQTAFVDDAGRLELREDVYGRDVRLLAALNSEDRRVADIPIQHRDPRRQAVRLQRPFYGNNVPWFFGWLFR